MKSLILRDAIPEDARVATELIYLAGQSFFNHTFGFGGDKKKALEFIDYAYRKDEGAFSHKYAVIAQLDGKVTGLELGYDGKTKKLQEKIVEKQIMKYYNFFQLVSLFGRGQHVKRFFAEAPEDIYYLASIAVVPEARKKGIGTKLVKNVFEKMRDVGLKKCMLDVSVTKEDTIRFYRNFGFKIIAEYRNPRLEQKHTLDGQYRMSCEI
jgi:ribosomal protein S18 acetylase RimI-like enzyme